MPIIANFKTSSLGEALENEVEQALLANNCPDLIDEAIKADKAFRAAHPYAAGYAAQYVREAMAAALKAAAARLK